MAPTPDQVFFSTNVTDSSGGVIIFVRQGLSFSELSTSSLSSLDPYSDHSGVNISLNDSSLLSFLSVYTPFIRSSPKNSRTNFFSSSILPSYVEAEAVEFLHFRFRFHIPDQNDGERKKVGTLMMQKSNGQIYCNKQPYHNRTER